MARTPRWAQPNNVADKLRNGEFEKDEATGEFIHKPCGKRLSPKAVSRHSTCEKD